MNNVTNYLVVSHVYLMHVHAIHHATRSSTSLPASHSGALRRPAYPLDPCPTLPPQIQRAANLLQQAGGRIESTIFAEQWTELYPEDPLTSDQVVCLGVSDSPVFVCAHMAQQQMHTRAIHRRPACGVGFPGLDGGVCGFHSCHNLHASLVRASLWPTECRWRQPWREY